MDLSIPFFGVVATSYVANYLDWKNTVNLFKVYGPAGEKNAWMKFLMSKSIWLGAAWKAWPMALMTWGAYFHFHDIQNFGVEYANAPGQHDYWALAWIGSALVATAVGLYGYFKSSRSPKTVAPVAKPVVPVAPVVKK